MDNCHICGIPYDDSFADWTICRDCKYNAEMESGREVVFMDSLGITYTQEEIDEFGGIEEIKRLNKEAKYENRNNR